MFSTSQPNRSLVGILGTPDQPQLGPSAWEQLGAFLETERLRLLSLQDAASNDAAIVADVDVAFVAAVTPSILPAIVGLWRRGVPVVTPAIEGAQTCLHTGAHFISPDVGWPTVARELERLLNDEAEREALVRKGHAQRRRLERRLAEGFPRAADTGDDDAKPSPSRPQVSVIVPTQGGLNLQECVTALRRAAGSVDLQVILVVTGGAAELPPCDRLVSCDPPFVWVKANNAGLQAATGTFVLLLNDDAFFTDEGDLDRISRSWNSGRTSPPWGR